MKTLGNQLWLPGRRMSVPADSAERAGGWTIRIGNIQDLAIVPVLVIGALLRLWGLGSSPFLSDAAGIYSLAQDAVVRHALPVTGLISSILVYNPPGAIYLYLPFVLAGDPVFGAYATAAANVIAVGLAYYFGRRYLGYWPALIGALLFAVAAWPVFYSRFIWQQNLLPPFVMWFVLLLGAGMAGKSTRWIVWALPVWGLTVQLHLTMLAPGLLLPLVWLLSPRRARLREIATGCAALAILYVPTLLWEVTSHFYDLQAIRAYSHQPAAVDLASLQQFLAISGLPAWVSWHGSTLYRGLLVLSQVIAAAGLLYLFVRVLWQGVAALRASRLGDGDRACGWRWMVWMRAPEQWRWRIDLLLVAWPAVILLSQIAHHSTVYPYYLLGALPAQFLAAGILCSDLPRLGRVFALRWHVSGALSALAGVVLVADVAAQVAATPAFYPQLNIRPLDAEKAGFTQAEGLVRQRHVALVVIEPDFFTLDSVSYLLRNGYHLSVPVQVVVAGRCLPAAPQGDTTLYLMSGPVTASELYISHLVGVTDVFAGTPAGGFFRAYVVTSAALAAHLSSPAGWGDMPVDVNFGGQVVLRRIWEAAGIDQTPVLALAYHFVVPVPGQPFDVYYSARVEPMDRNGQARGVDQETCNMQPWIAGERAFLFFPHIAGGSLVQAVRVRISAYRSAYAVPKMDLGPVQLETAYVLAIGHYYLPRPAAIGLPVVQCDKAVFCEHGYILIIVHPPSE
jgi:hypothetical protein